ncbi:hypothetical protein M5K25_013596 [Dendrobium thyrsiflorum]|uniref:Uncharacterized protein n=1 Tax=Dendrobium thyrsiflorum TaxID=117978 RepID=A0ABD0UTF3_DENTH
MLNQHFFPSFIRDVPSQTCSINEPRAYHQVNVLQRIPFSFIRRPRPLLEGDPPATHGEEILEQRTSVNPLDQEPMFAARITIEDCMRLLPDVDDIDRVIQFGQSQDSGSQLKWRQQVHHEGIAASLQFVDPFGPGKAGHSVGLTTKDDLVFLRLVSLPKGENVPTSGSGSPFSWEEERLLKEPILDVIFQKPKITKLQFLHGLEKDLEGIEYYMWNTYDLELCLRRYFSAASVFDAAKDIMKALRNKHPNLASKLEALLLEIGSRFVTLPEERLLDVVNASLHYCYKYPTATTTEVPQSLKKELSGFCRICFTADAMNKHVDFVRK